MSGVPLYHSRTEKQLTTFSCTFAVNVPAEIQCVCVRVFGSVGVCVCVESLCACVCQRERE
jgi:hypothetical protein